MTIAAMRMAEKNVFSTLWRCLYKILQKEAGDLRPFRGEMRGVMPLVLRAAR